MKLEAASRLVTALAEDQTMTLKSVADALANRSIESESPDDVGNSIVAFDESNTVIRALVKEGWIIKSRRLVDGGLYCSGTSTILEFNDQQIKLLATSMNRVTVWNN
jgi:hypothetical protein